MKMMSLEPSRAFLWLITSVVALSILPAVASGTTPPPYYLGLDHGLPESFSDPHEPAGGLPRAPFPPDAFQRYIIFRNEMSLPVYPVISASESENCGPLVRLRRILVNSQSRDRGVPTGETVKVMLPKDPHCWYNAVRVYIFTVNVGAFEDKLNEKQRTVPDNDIIWNPPLCPNDACWSGHSIDQYPADSPAQLLEYTIDSIDPENGKRFPDANNPNGIPMVDLDLSYVDEVFLPVTMALDDGGVTRYMGTAITYGQFNQRTQTFLDIIQQNVPLWSQYAAFSSINWPHNVFNQLARGRTNRIEGGYNFVHNVKEPAAQSALYTPTSNGPKECSATPACKSLPGNCCPANDGKFLACCDVQPFIIDDTIKVNGKANNPSVNAFVARWKQWIDGNPCTDLSKIPAWPSNRPEFDRQGFCDGFRETARYVWQAFESKCTAVSGAEKDLCILDGILGFLSKDSTDGRLNQSVQAVQRSVPWGDPKNPNAKQYQNDKFVLFWAPYDSIFNLNPYTRLVHNKVDGLDAPGAYSFSIDDRFGNFQNRASGFIVDLGGLEVLPNKEAFDFYQQYRVVWGPGWDHADVCGRRVPIPLLLGSNAPVSMWRNGKRFPNCRIFLYKGSTDTMYAAFRLSEKSKTVVDTYTGLQHQIKELTIPDPDFCKNNSSPELVSICDRTKLSITPTGEEAYVSVPDDQKPFVNLNPPGPP
jgi:hypothetical protein